jgi:GNAT superfamily N-acetyltransferase
MNIRLATPQDVAVVTDFNLRLAAETEQLQLDPTTVRAGVAAVLADAHKGRYFLAEIEGRIAGQLMITYEWSDWRNGNLWWLQSVYVHPDFRSRGVFRALFAHLTSLARARPDVAGLRLYMHHGNDPARRTYERVGMQRAGYEVFEMDFVLNRNAESKS